MFWSRGQYPSDPGRPSSGTDPATPQQAALRMADAYTEVGLSLVNEHLVAARNMPFTSTVPPRRTPS